MINFYVHVSLKQILRPGFYTVFVTITTFDMIDWVSGLLPYYFELCEKKYFFERQIWPKIDISKTYFFLQQWNKNGHQNRSFQSVVKKKNLVKNRKFGEKIKFDHNINFWSNFRFMTELLMFDRTFNFLSNFRFLIELSIFDRTFDCLSNFWFLIELLIVHRTFDFWSNFRFLIELSIFAFNSCFWQQFGFIYWKKVRSKSLFHFYSKN